MLTLAKPGVREPWREDSSWHYSPRLGHGLRSNKLMAIPGWVGLGFWYGDEVGNLFEVFVRREVGPWA